MKNGLFVAASVAAVVCATGVYLSQTLVKSLIIERQFLPSIIGVEVSTQYPYSDVDVPEDFVTYSLDEIEFKAPEGLYGKGADTRLLTDNDDKNERECYILLLDDESVALPSIVTEPKFHFFDKRLKNELKSMGYEKVESTYDIINLCETIEVRDYNKFSTSEVNVAFKLSLLKAIMVPSNILFNNVYGELDPESIGYNRYYYNTDEVKSFVSEQVNENGAYQLQLTIFDVNDLNKSRALLVVCKEPEIARQIASTIIFTEE